MFSDVGGKGGCDFGGGVEAAAPVGGDGCGGGIEGKRAEDGGVELHDGDTRLWISWLIGVMS